MAFAVVCRDIWRVSLTLARCWSSSLVESVRWDSETSGSLEEYGSCSKVDCMSGRRTSTVSGSGTMGRGPEKDDASEVNVRD